MAGWFIWKLFRLYDVRPMVGLALIIAFFTGKSLQDGFFRGFHPEIFGMTFALGFIWAIGARRHFLGVFLGLLCLSCREDFSLFFMAYSLFWLLSPSTRKAGLSTFLVCLAWGLFAYGLVIPHYSASGRMEGIERWAQYGENPLDIAQYWVVNPAKPLLAMVNHKAMSHIGRLLFLPLLDPASTFAIALPWLIYTTSSFSQQASLSGAYASMFLAFLFVGVIRVFSRERFKKWLRFDGFALTVVLALIVINIRGCPWPRSFSGLALAHDELSVINKAVFPQRILAQGCLIPHLKRSLQSEMIGSPQMRKFDDYDLVIISIDKDPWPLDKKELMRLLNQLKRSDKWIFQEYGCLQIFRRAAGKERVSPITRSPASPYSCRSASMGSRREAEMAG